MSLLDKILIIVNPKSNGGRPKHKLKRVISWFDSYKIRYKVIYSKSREETIDVVSKDTEYNIYVGAGGDGNQNAIMQGIMKNRQKKILAVVPEGFANDYSKVFNPFKNEKKLRNSLEHKNTKEIDVGKINENYFLLYAGIGLGATTLEERAKGHSLGKLSYPRAIFIAFSKLEPINIEIEFEGKKICEKISLAEFINLGPYANGLKLCPNAKSDDDKLDLCLIKGKPNLAILVYDFLLARKGKHINRPEISCYQSPQFKIFSSIPLEYQFDGERGYKKTKYLNIEVAKKKLKVLV